MGLCFAPDCHHKGIKNSCKFFRFPLNPEDRQKWITACGRDDRQPEYYDLLCSCHFKDGLKQNFPSIFNRNKQKLSSFPSPVKKKSKLKAASNSDSTNGFDLAHHFLLEKQLSSPAFQHADISGKLPASSESDSPSKSTSELPTATTVSEIPTTSRFELPETQVENCFLREQVSDFQKHLPVLPHLTFSHIESSDELVHHYTGLPSKKEFLILYKLISRFEFKYFKKWNLIVKSAQDQLLITLMKLRLNLTYKDLAFRFGVSVATVENVFVTFVTLIHEILFKGMMNIIPSSQKNGTDIPECFSEFPQCRIVIDCIEIEVAIPQTMDKKSLTFSHYKQRHTFKGLVGVAPNATITFVSELFPGSTSDTEIVNQCGLLEKFKPGDMILADKGFLLKDVLPPSVIVNVPPFLSNPQFTRKEAEVTQSIARARIHVVERAIARVKAYRILDFVPANMKAHANKIFAVCCSLVNLQRPLLNYDNRSTYIAEVTQSSSI